jgi:tripartite-type tricarboxylate transporter receptor subunit TctC
VLALCTAGARAADWPAKPVRIVSPFAPGGTSDLLARLIAAELTQKFGQQFFVENRGGAGGLIGTAAVAGADPDGSTFVVSSVGAHVTSPATSAHPPYDPLRDFSHVAYLGGPPNVIVVHPSLGVRSLPELLAAAQRAPVDYISPGLGTVGHLVPELLARRQHLKFTHVSYKGAGQAMTDLVAGHVKMGSVTWSSAVAQIRAGTVLPLAVSSTRPMPEFPAVPTMTVLGHGDLVAVTWFGLSGPAGVPKDIIASLNAAVVTALDAPAVREKLAAEGIETEKMSPNEFTAFIGNEIAKWAPLAKAVAGADATGGPR